MKRQAWWIGLACVGLLSFGGPVQAQKYGGTLRTMATANPVSLSLYEGGGVSTSWPVTPMYSNLVWYDTFDPVESPESIRPDLAESWSWSADKKSLTFKLRTDVRFHDGTPFTSKDVKHSTDVLRGRSLVRIKLNPRKPWFSNVEDVVTNGDHEVTVRLKRPQPSLLSFFASGYIPMFPAHVNPNLLRTTENGTGPFKLKSFERDNRIEMVKDPNYYRKGRPYLDGISFVIIRERAAQTAALVSHQVDLGSIFATPTPVYLELDRAKAGLAFMERLTNTTVNIIVNTRKPPFNNLRMRQVVNLAMDRNGLKRTVYQGGSVVGGAMIPSPYGLWGLTAEQLAQLPGYGDPVKNKAEARRILAEEGYTEANPFKLKVSTRAIQQYIDPAVWSIGELKAVGIQAELEQIDNLIWFAKVARRDFQFAINATAVGVDDPDAAFYENYSCDAERNYSDYCNPELMKKVELQSMEFDTQKRKAMVQEIDTQLQREVARPYLAYRVDYYPHYPYVKNFIPHQSLYNTFNFAEVWMDK